MRAVTGTALGALAKLALVAANVSLFIASPLIAPLAMLGEGASLGGFVGRATGAGNQEGRYREGRFETLARDAISTGQVVLVAKTTTAQETAITQEVMQVSVNNYCGLCLA
ncbi:MAG: hypothetical protein ABI790_15420 [Betaproteobacteria bacterium]